MIPARPLTAGLRRRVERIAAAPYGRTLGVRVEDVRADGVRLRLPYRDENANRNGSLHGGVLASVIDMAAALAVGTAPASRAGLPGRTLDLAVHYLAPARREGLIADATVVRRGRVTTFVAVEVRTDGDRPVARGLVAYWTGGDARRAGPPRASAPPSLPSVALTRPSGSPFTRRLGVRSARLGRGEAFAVLPAQDDVADHAGRVHGGALAALADCACGASAWSVAGFDPLGRAATVAMHLGYDVSARGEDVLALATTPWRGDGMLVNTVTLVGRTSGRPLATGTVTYRIVS
jgi:uncharacterized protein (TIGR00369 family)